MTCSAETLFAITRTPAFAEYVKNLLLEVCAVDTGPNPDVNVMRQAEAAVFDVLERELRQAGLSGLRWERRPVDPAIADNPHFTPLHFTKTPARPKGLSPRQAYRQRANLVAILPCPDAGQRGTAMNAHVDVIAPYIPPRYADGVVYGRGACDDKGGVVGMVAALNVLGALQARGLFTPRENLVAMFPIEEETGGNGSLSLALDAELSALYDTILVGECTEMRLFPANRGAVWYKAEIVAGAAQQLPLAAFIIGDMEFEGRALRTESRHPLFPQRPVQTCHGIMGPVGQHPSRICGDISFRIEVAGDLAAVEPLVGDCLQAGLGEYIGLYGDKTKIIDPLTGKPKVDHHFDLTPVPGGLEVRVFGATGHMGSIFENDGAITKLAAMVRALVRSLPHLQKVAGGTIALVQSGHTDPARLVLEGGQGFLPTHDITAVMARLRQAAERGVAAYQQLTGLKGVPRRLVKVTYDKLHNAAFDGDPDSPAMQRAIAAARLCGGWRDEPIMGWHVSCDSRLFASLRPGLAVITTGPGKLTHAHADAEQVRIDEVRQHAEFLVAFLLSH